MAAWAVVTLVDRDVAERGPPWWRDNWDPTSRRSQRRWDALPGDTEPGTLDDDGRYTRRGNIGPLIDQQSDPRRKKLFRAFTLGRGAAAAEVARCVGAVVILDAVDGASLVLIAFDLDGRDVAPARAEFQARTASLPDQPVWVLALAAPEFEAWCVAGFVPADDDERSRVDTLRAALGFDPTRSPHRLSSTADAAARDAKAVLDALCPDMERQSLCLAMTPLETLEGNGREAGPAQFLADLAAVRERWL